MKGCQEQPVSGTGGPVGEGLVGKIVGPAIQKIGVPFGGAHDLPRELAECARSVEIETGIWIVARGRIDALAVVIVVKDAQRFEIAGEILPAEAREPRRRRLRGERPFGEDRAGLLQVMPRLDAHPRLGGAGSDTDGAKKAEN